MSRVFAILCLVVFAGSYGDEVRIVRKGLTQPDQPGPMLVTNVIRFLASAGYQSTAYAVKSNTWQELLASDSYVYVKLRPPRRVTLSGLPPADLQQVAPRERVEISEIIVPLPEEHGPLHIYARIGTNTVSHTKFSPAVFKELIQEPGLKMQDTKVFKNYSRLPLR